MVYWVFGTVSIIVGHLRMHTDCRRIVFICWLVSRNEVIELSIRCNRVSHYLCLLRLSFHVHGLVWLFLGKKAFLTRVSRALFAWDTSVFLQLALAQTVLGVLCQENCLVLKRVYLSLRWLIFGDKVLITFGWLGMPMLSLKWLIPWLACMTRWLRHCICSTNAGLYTLVSTRWPLIWWHKQ